MERDELLMPDTIKCKDCPEILEIPDTFVTSIDNGAMSVLVCQHGDAIICTGCGAVYAKVVDAKISQIVTKTRQIAKGNPRVVIPGNGLLGTLKPQ